MKYSETRIYKLACEFDKLARKAVSEYSSKFSKRIFTQNQHVAVLCIKAKSMQKLRETEGMLANMQKVREAIGLHRVHDFTTICKAMQRLSAKVQFRKLLELDRMSHDITVSFHHGTLLYLTECWRKNTQSQHI